MMRITQKEMVFYKLYKEFNKNPFRYVNAWEFVGEMYISELDKWVLMSYKTPANGVKIYFENPGLIERIRVEGKSGSKYYAYRFVPDMRIGFLNEIIDYKIIDPNLREFYKKIVNNKN